MMKTNREQMKKSIEACIVLCENHKKTKELQLVKKEIIQAGDVRYLELKLQRLTKTLASSRYKDVRSELVNLIAIVDSMSKNL